MLLHHETAGCLPSYADEKSAPQPRIRWPQSVVCNSLSIIEAILVGLIASLLLECIPGAAEPGTYAMLGGAFALTTTMFCAVLYGSAGYDGFLSRRALIPGAATAAILVSVSTALMGAKLPYILFVALAMASSVYIAKLPTALLLQPLRKVGLLTRLAAIVADDPQQRQALIRVLRDREDIKIVFSGSPSAVPTLRDLTREGMLDEIILAGNPPVPEPISALAGLAVTLVRVTPSDKFEQWSGRRRGKRHGNRWNAPAAIISEPPLRNWNILAKRVIDVSCSLLLLLLLAPAILLCAIAIRLESPGSPLFVQQRIGYRDKPFRIFKFRSMYMEKADQNGSQLTLRNNFRVTRVGAILRRISADELPQLFNVLLGDMSLVGPRPHPRGVKAGNTAYDDLIPEFYSRYRMKPGITGLAQISGFRGNTETEQHLISRFDYDLKYAAEWTPFLDFVILARTLVHVVKGTNAF